MKVQPCQPCNMIQCKEVNTGNASHPITAKVQPKARISSAEKLGKCDKFSILVAWSRYVISNSNLIQNFSNGKTDENLSGETLRIKTIFRFR